MKPQVTKESLAQWIAELESQPHLSLREERYLAVMKKCMDYIGDCHHVWIRGLAGFRCEKCGDGWGSEYANS